MSDLLAFEEVWVIVSVGDIGFKLQVFVIAFSTFRLEDLCGILLMDNTGEVEDDAVR
jgi:hypothetical protein